MIFYFFFITNSFNKNYILIIFIYFNVYNNGLYITFYAKISILKIHSSIFYTINRSPQKNYYSFNKCIFDYQSVNYITIRFLINII